MAKRTILRIGGIRVLARVVRGPRRGAASGQVFAAVALLVLALQSRLALPFIPLHANHHAWEDLAVLLGAADAGPAIGRHLEIYGASWLVARRALLPLFGGHFDGVGLAAAWWGASAVLLSVLAALGAGGTRIAVGVGALALVWAPVVARVAHSESDLVVGQWLLAAGLWLATREGRLALAGLAASIGLLALGHVVGPPLALGLALMAVAIRPATIATDNAATPAGSDASRVLPPPQSAQGQLVGFVGENAPRLRAAGVLAVALLAATGLRLLSAGAHVGGRLDRIEQAIPIPLQPWKYSLWVSPDYASSGLWVLALLGVMGALWVRWQQARWRGVAVELPLWLGVLAVMTTSLLVCASLTDGLRYQSLLLAPMLLLAGRAGLAWRYAPKRWRWAFGLVCAIAWTTTLVETARGFAGRATHDSQAQEWLHLRAALAHRSGKLHLLRPARQAGGAAVFEVPQGQWTAHGPETVALDAVAAMNDCRRGAILPAPTFAVRFAACGAATVTGAPACDDALAFRVPGQPLAALPVALIPPLMRRGLPGEFLSFDDRPDGNRPDGKHIDGKRTEVPWQLYAAQCPPTR